MFVQIIVLLAVAATCIECGMTGKVFNCYSNLHLQLAHLPR